MNSTIRRAVAGATVGLLATAGLATPASAAGPPPLDPGLLRRAIAGLPGPTMTGAMVSVRGTDGRWTGRSGVADVRTGERVPLDGRYRIASVTKVFTAVLVLRLAAEHRVDLTRSVQHYLPGKLPADYPPVTVGQLLDHTSGLPFSLVDAGNADPRWVAGHRLDYWTPQQVVDSAVAQPMAAAPSSEQRYNGLNYFLAGMVIEKVTGQAYAEELSRRILRPLGLRDTYLPAPRDAKLRGPHAHGYVTVDGALVDVTEQSPWGWAESGLVSGSADLTRFFTALYTGRLLPAAQLAEMFTLPDVPFNGGNCRLGPDPGRACFSMGLQATTFPDGVTVWGKSGGMPGYTTGVFATRDLSRLLVSSLNPTGNRNGGEGPYVQNIAAACFDPSLFSGGS